MPVKTLLVTALLALSAPAAIAMCSGEHKTTSDCKPGETRDPISGSCIKPVSS